MLPCVNCCLTLFKIVPEPIEEEAFCNGDVANISPNSALDLLKPVVFTFSLFLDGGGNCDCGAVSAVSAV